jgi:hypothetical protein
VQIGTPTGGNAPAGVILEDVQVTDIGGVGFPNGGIATAREQTNPGGSVQWQITVFVVCATPSPAGDNPYLP